jgi:hypothetical protein
MKYFVLASLLSAHCVCAQDAVTSLQMGDSLVQFVTENPGQDKRILFINVHENEATSMQAVRAYDVTDKYPFMYLKHNGTRRVAFNHDGIVYSVDPNRIFSHRGIDSTLAHDTLYVHNKKAVKMSKQLARGILKTVKDAWCIISLHNNTPGNYSILSYQPGQAEAPNTKDLYINPKMDSDDFIYTTSTFLFLQLKVLEINVILQDNQNCVDDGSLSVYCGKHGIPYANVEAEEGHLNQQIDLIAKLIGVVELLRE